jgi:hypothetical protein
MTVAEYRATFGEWPTTASGHGVETVFFAHEHGLEGDMVEEVPGSHRLLSSSSRRPGYGFRKH